MDRRRERGLGGDDGDENSLCFFEFAEALVSLADAAFGMDAPEEGAPAGAPARAGPAGAFEKVCAARVAPLAAALGYATARAVLRSRPLVLLVSSSLEALQGAFDYYAVPAGDEKGRRRVAAWVRSRAAGGGPAGAGAGAPAPARSAAPAPPAADSAIVINASRATVDCAGALGGAPVVRAPGWVALLDAAARAAARRGAPGQLPAPARPPQDEARLLPLEGFAQLLAHAGLATGGGAAPGGSAGGAPAGALDIAPALAEAAAAAPGGGGARRRGAAVFPAPGALGPRDVARAYWGALGVALTATPVPAGLTLAQLAEALAWVGLTKWAPAAGAGAAWAAELAPDEADAWRAAAARVGAPAGAPPPPPLRAAPPALLPALCRAFLEWAVEDVAALGAAPGAPRAPPPRDARAAAARAADAAADAAAVAAGGADAPPAETVLLDYVDKKKTPLPGGRVLANGPSSPLSNFRGDATVAPRRAKARAPLPFAV